MSDIHAERRPPSTPDPPLDLEQAGSTLLDEARGMSSGRAAKSLTPGAHAPLKQTLVALRSGVRLGEHTTNGPATIQLLRGSATITWGGDAIELSSGEWSPVPAEEHDLAAHDDVVALFTSAPTAPSPRPS